MEILSWVGTEHVSAQQPQATTKKIVADVADNRTLNDKQKLFCLHYLQSFNATKAYQQAYNVAYKTAMASGSRLLTNPKITAELKRLKQIRQEATAMTTFFDEKLS